MRRALPDLLPWLLVVVASTAAFYAIQANPELEETFEWFSPRGHLQVVTIASAICALLAGVVSVVVLRSSNARLLWLALAFLGMSGLYAVHGLTTPGIILDSKHLAVVGFSGRLAFLVCSIFLAASAVTWKGRGVETIARYRAAILVLTVAALMAYAVVALWRPEFVPQWFAGAEANDGYGAADVPSGSGSGYAPEPSSGASYGGDY